jgi:DNA-binding transcriptional LysR family regulator
VPRDADPAFYNAVVSACHGAGLSPAFEEIGTHRVEDALLAVAAGAGMALLPEPVAERYTVAGIRCVPLAGSMPAVQCAVVTHPDTDSLATLTCRRAVAAAAKVDRSAAERAQRLVAVAA